MHILEISLDTYREYCSNRLQPRQLVGDFLKDKNKIAIQKIKKKKIYTTHIQIYR